MLEYGQKNISTVKRNLLNVDEILRLPSNKLIVSLRGNKPLLLDKVIYKEHPLAKKLKDDSVSNYNPTWTKNYNTHESKEKPKEEPNQEQKNNSNNEPEVSWDTF